MEQLSQKSAICRSKEFWYSNASSDLQGHFDRTLQLALDLVTIRRLRLGYLHQSMVSYFTRQDFMTP